MALSYDSGEMLMALNSYSEASSEYVKVREAMELAIKDIRTNWNGDAFNEADKELKQIEDALSAISTDLEEIVKTGTDIKTNMDKLQYGVR